jgi:transposase, IS5 family
MRPKQVTFAEASFERYRKPTRREEFLAQMNTVVLWEKFAALIEPVYPSGEGVGRPPIGLERLA